MKIFDVEPNSAEWHLARCGKATASCFDKIITAARGDPSKQAEDYANQIVAEILTGDPTDDFKGNVWTDRGHELEPEAIKAYCLLRQDAEVQPGKFCSNDEETYGASPDNFVQIPIYDQDGVISSYDEGLLEIKCFMPKNHTRMLLNPEPDREHWPQLQGQLLVTSRAWVDIMFYHPKLPPAVVRVHRDEEYLIKLKNALDVFVNTVKQKVTKIEGVELTQKDAA